MRLRVNMKHYLIPQWYKIMLRKRYIIGTINDILMNMAQLVYARQFAKQIYYQFYSAPEAYCFFENKPKVLTSLCVLETQQLSIF